MMWLNHKLKNKDHPCIDILVNIAATELDAGSTPPYWNFKLQI